jgi:DNA-binding MarR family transcriptional regulator
MKISVNKKVELSKEKIDFHLKRTRYLFNEFYITSTKYKTISYLRRNAAGWLIMNIMMEYYFANKELRVEKLASKISSKVCSRATLLSMLKSAEIRKVIKKTKSLKDRRAIIVSPTDEFISEFNKWTDEFYDSEGFKMKKDYKI